MLCNATTPTSAKAYGETTNDTFKSQTQSFLQQLLVEIKEEMLLHPTDIHSIHVCMYVDIVDAVYEK